MFLLFQITYFLSLCFLIGSCWYLRKLLVSSYLFYIQLSHWIISLIILYFHLIILGFSMHAIILFANSQFCLIFSNFYTSAFSYLTTLVSTTRTILKYPHLISAFSGKTQKDSLCKWSSCCFKIEFSFL